MSQYITSSELQSFLGVAIPEPQALLLADMCESFFNQIIWSDTLKESSKTAYFDFKEVYKHGGAVLYSPTYKPTSVTSINGVSAGVINTDYTILWRKITFKETLTVPTTFPERLTMVYVSWLDTIPNDVKTCCLYIGKGLWKNKESFDVASFKQDLLSVNYAGWKGILEQIIDPSEVNFIKMIANKYFVTHTYGI